jgi:short/branched chain acyl-CoA dehydrogenase
MSDGQIAIEILNEGRIGIAAQMIGLAQGAFDHAVGYAYQRKQFGKLVGDFQKMGHDFAEAAIKIEAARLLTYNAARLKVGPARRVAPADACRRRDDLSPSRRRWQSECGRARGFRSGWRTPAESTRYYASVIAQEVSGAAIEWTGGVGFTRDLPLEKFWRDSKIGGSPRRRNGAGLRSGADKSGAIYEGTNNIQLETIAKLIRKCHIARATCSAADLDQGKEYVQ